MTRITTKINNLREGDAVESKVIGNVAPLIEAVTSIINDGLLKQGIKAILITVEMKVSASLLVEKPAAPPSDQVTTPVGNGSRTSPRIA